MPRGSTVVACPFPTSDSAYNRIMWDDRFDSSDYEIGYLDRFRGMMFIPLEDFRKGEDEVMEIPYHRVHLIRTRAGTTVWDRARRMCLLDAIADGDMPANDQAPPQAPEASTAQATTEATAAAPVDATESSTTEDRSATCSMVLEMPTWGNRMLDEYEPQDALEQWLLRHSIREFARECPTHISQLGAMYHIPSTHDMFEQYLSAWAESVKSGLRFYVEEVRGSVFRLYIDIDLKTTVTSPVSLVDILPHILTYVRSSYSAIESDASVVVTDCHGEYEDTTNAAVCYKSGYRLYFSDLFIDNASYKLFIDSLSHYVEQHCAIPSGCTPGTTWQDIFDTHGSTWERARLFGTVKRRKALDRRYSFNSSMRLVNGCCEESPRSDEYLHDLKALLLATNVRLWDSPLIVNTESSNSVCVPH